MKTSRRKFLSHAALSASAAALFPLSSCRSGKGNGFPVTDYAALDKARKKPVLKRELFPSPVIIDKLELLRDRNNCICRVRSKEGAEGISIGHPFISKQSYPMFRHALHGRFVGKDARDLDDIMYRVAETSVKIQGVPFNVQLATIEFAILDMLGTIANKPVGQLIGDILNPEIAIYLGTRLGDLRRKEPEVSLELVAQDLEKTDAQAIKIRAGRGDNLASDIDNAPGRTEKLIRMAREKFGDDMVLMIDGNGSYSVKEAIRIGKILEEYRYYWYEEPLPWDWYQEQKQVEQALDIMMAGGEEEFSMHNFRWLLGNHVWQVIMPDIFYFGGMIRSMKVAYMAKAQGIEVSPHVSSGGLGYVYLLHMVSACPNAAEYHEFKMFETRDANGTPIPVESKTEPFKSVNGLIEAPTGSGLGVIIDPEYIKTHRVIYG